LPPLETYGPVDEWLVRVVPNRFPAFGGDDPFDPRTIGRVFRQAPGTGVHEVLVLSRSHDATWADLDDKQVGLVMAALRDRMEAHARRSDVAYTQAIVNQGREAGASLAHPHGQLLGIPFVPGELLEECAGFARHPGEQCLLCTTIEEERRAAFRVVDDSAAAFLVCPFWSGVPYELLVIPEAHAGSLHHAAPGDLVAVGRALRTGLRALRAAVGDVAYNIVLHTAPRDHDGPFHWHAHVLPRITSVAGFEQGTGVFINIVAPERAAERLRAALP
jgi:UDPglucose--hexose-1-phosphate uridylyltransferase